MDSTVKTLSLAAIITVNRDESEQNKVHKTCTDDSFRKIAFNIEKLSSIIGLDPSSTVTQLTKQPKTIQSRDIAVIKNMLSQAHTQLFEASNINTFYDEADIITVNLKLCFTKLENCNAMLEKLLLFISSMDLRQQLTSEELWAVYEPIVHLNNIRQQVEIEQLRIKLGHHNIDTSTLRQSESQGAVGGSNTHTIETFDKHNLAQQCGAEILKQLLVPSKAKLDISAAQSQKICNMPQLQLLCTLISTEKHLSKIYQYIEKNAQDSGKVHGGILLTQLDKRLDLDLAHSLDLVITDQNSPLYKYVDKFEHLLVLISLNKRHNLFTLNSLKSVCDILKYTAKGIKLIQTFNKDEIAMFLRRTQEIQSKLQKVLSDVRAQSGLDEKHFSKLPNDLNTIEENLRIAQKKQEKAALKYKAL